MRLWIFFICLMGIVLVDYEEFYNFCCMFGIVDICLNVIINMVFIVLFSFGIRLMGSVFVVLFFFLLFFLFNNVVVLVLVVVLLFVVMVLLVVMVFFLSFFVLLNVFVVVVVLDVFLDFVFFDLMIGGFMGLSFFGGSMGLLSISSSISLNNGVIVRMVISIFFDGLISVVVFVFVFGVLVLFFNNGLFNNVDFCV